MKKNLLTTLFLVLSFRFLSFAQLQELIDDGSFDQSSPNWIQSPDFYITNTTTFMGACSPLGYAWFADVSGGYPIDGATGYVYQSIFVPSNSLSVYLSFWYSISTLDGGAANDLFNVQIFSNGNWIPIYLLSNLDVGPCTYSGNIDLSAFIGQTISVGFVASTDFNGLGTKFRVDDVSVLADVPQTCVSWVNGTPSNGFYLNAAENLCQSFLIDQIQDNAVDPCPRYRIAEILFNGLFGMGGSSYSDYFPTPFMDINFLTFQDQQAYKTMLYLERGDNVSVFPRENFTLNPSGWLYRTEALKAIFEAWAISTSSPPVPPPGFYNDIPTNHPYYKYIVTAFMNGYMANTSIQLCNPQPCFSTAMYMTQSDFYIIVSNIVTQNYIPPLPTQADYFLPNTFLPTNFSNKSDIDRAVFNDYENSSFFIAGGGLPIEFTHSYHSNWVELPYSANESLDPIWYRQMHGSLGVGWTHSYNIFIRKLYDGFSNCVRLLIWWSDGTLHSYDNVTHQYETSGVTDELTIDSVDTNGEPAKVTITQKNGVVFKFIVLPSLSDYMDLSLTEIKDRNNHSISLSYSVPVIIMPMPRLDYVTDNFSGRSLYFNYQPGTNYLTSVVDAYGGRTIYFNVNPTTQDLESSTDAKGQVTHYQYDPTDPHLLTQIQKPKGNWITNSYFKKKLQSSVAGSYNVSVNFNTNYLSGGQTTNSQISVNQGGNIYTSFIQHDNRGNPISVTLPAGSITTQYNDPNNPDEPTYILDNNTGIATSISYEPNARANIIQTSTSGNGETVTENWVYNNLNEVTEHHDPQGTITNYSYDTNGNLTDIFQGGSHQHFEVNASSYLLDYSVDPMGVTTYYHYNNFGNPDSIYIGGSNIYASCQYDNDSRCTLTKDASGIVTQYVYDPNDNITDIVFDPVGLNYLTHRSYDPNDNLLSIVAPKGDATNLTYDFQTDELLAETYGTFSKSWLYNTDGTINRFTSKNGFNFDFTYLPQGDPNAGKIVSDGYITNTYDNSTHNLMSCSRGTNQLSYSYDGLNRVNAISYNDISNNSVQYTYYPNTYQLKQIIYPQVGGFSGLTVQYGYDSSNRLSQVKNASTGYSYVQYFYRDDNKVDHELFGNGITTQYFYDNIGRLDSIVSKKSNGDVISSVTCSLDNNGRHTNENCMRSYSGPGGSPNGPGIDSSFGYTYNNMNRIATAGSFGYSHDGNGNIILSQSPNASYTWDERDNLLTKNVFGAFSSFGYDPLENRRVKDTTRYILDVINGSNILMETDLAGSPKSLYVYGLGLICRIDPASGIPSYYHYDFRGSTIAITDTGQSIMQWYEYDAFGVLTNSAGWGNMFSNPFTYVGKYGVVQDDERVYYMRARYYSPQLGRFISEDPKWDENLFPYGGNNPLSNIDPDGEFFETALDAASLGYSTYELYKHPSFKNFAFFAWDAASVALPFVPGSYSLKIAEKGISYTKSSLSLGRKMHDTYRLSEHAPELGRYKEFRGISGIRPDFVDLRTKTVYEYKPNNPNSIKRGWKQLKRYKSKLEKEFGGEWKMVLDKY